jgi:hypothetical protein
VNEDNEAVKSDTSINNDDRVSSVLGSKPTSANNSIPIANKKEISSTAADMSDDSIGIDSVASSIEGK